MSEEMRSLAVDVAMIETLDIEVGNVKLRFQNGMLVYDKAATKVIVNGVTVLDKPARTRAKSVQTSYVQGDEFASPSAYGVVVPVSNKKKKTPEEIASEAV